MPKGFIFRAREFKNNWNDWRWYYFQFTHHIVPIYFSFKKNNGIYIVEEDWDNLIILDACKYDIFEDKFKKSNIQGKLKKRVSRGSSTTEFLEENFQGKKFLDIVYVTTKPWEFKPLKNTFYKTINLWKDAWNIVLPEEVEKSAILAYEKYLNKRLIIHFLQPHCPFIGSYSKKGTFWQLALSEGKAEVMKAYKSNLDLVFPHVMNLINYFKGITVVTSDHGNACGECATPLKIPIWGHPTGVHIPALIEVPWLICKRGIKPRHRV